MFRVLDVKIPGRIREQTAANLKMSPKDKGNATINNLGWVLLLDLFHEFTSKLCIGLPQKSKSS